MYPCVWSCCQPTVLCQKALEQVVTVAPSFHSVMLQFLKVFCLLAVICLLLFRVCLALLVGRFAMLCQTVSFELLAFLTDLLLLGQW